MFPKNFGRYSAFSVRLLFPHGSTQTAFVRPVRPLLPYLAFHASTLNKFNNTDRNTTDHCSKDLKSNFIFTVTFTNFVTILRLRPQKDKNNTICSNITLVAIFKRPSVQTTEQLLLSYFREATLSLHFLLFLDNSGTE